MQQQLILSLTVHHIIHLLSYFHISFLISHILSHYCQKIVVQFYVKITHKSLENNHS